MSRAVVDVPVCVIGCGPIGLAGSLLLARHGVEVLIVERRSELNTHPRSRFVDTNTMELLRELGIEKDVEATGLGPDWTEFNRWSDNLAVEPYAELESPTFHAVPGPDSPCLPVMTVQDEVEKALMSKVSTHPSITVRFDTEAIEVSQDDDTVTVTLRNTTTGDTTTVTSRYVIGADGPGSSTRDVVGAELEAIPRPVYMQDVIFHADLSKYVGDRKGGLLYTQPPEGVLIFQPLDGVERWRIQVSVGSPELVSEAEILSRLAASLGTDEDVDVDIQSMRMWQPTPGCVTRFRNGRVFLAGDAAHIAVPTGGLGNNSGFSGIRNLAWKLAHVLHGHADDSILDTYEEEHRPVALERIAYGIETTDVMGRMMIGHRRGLDIAEATEATRRYADYDHLLRGFEMSSPIIDPEPDPAPDVTASTFTPLVRAGRRAPHIWIDEAQGESVLDWFGIDHVLLLGPDADEAVWSDAVDRLRSTGTPLGVRRLPDADIGPYRRDEGVLVRPDGVIAAHRT